MRFPESGGPGDWTMGIEQAHADLGRPPGQVREFTGFTDLGFKIILEIDFVLL